LNPSCCLRAARTSGTHAERSVRSLKEACLDHLIFIGEGSLRRAPQSYTEHYHHERNHQGIGNAIPFPKRSNPARAGPVRQRLRRDGLLNYYFRQAA
jgi:hypothetical protein